MSIFDMFKNKNNNEVEVKNSVDEIELDLSQNTIITWKDEEEEIKINEQQAMQVPAINGGVDLIAGSIASLDVKLYKYENDGTKVELKEDYRNELLNKSNSLFDSAFNLKYAQVKNLILHGTTYTYIPKYNDNKIQALYYLDENDVNHNLYKISKGIYDYKFGFTLFEDYVNCNSDEMMIGFKQCKRSTDITGSGILQNEKIIQLALEEINSSNNAITNKVGGYLYTDNSLSPNAKKNIRKSWKGLSRIGQVPVLEEGLKFNTINQKPSDLELLDSRKYSTECICQILNIPFTYLNSSASSYNTSSEESLRFVKNCLNPYINILEEMYNKYLLSAKEQKQGLFFKFDRSSILKANAKEELEYLKSAKLSGIITINEARQELGKKPIDGADFLEIGVNTYQLVDGKITLPSQNIENMNNNNTTDNIDNNINEE